MVDLIEFIKAGDIGSLKARLTRDPDIATTGVVFRVHTILAGYGEI